MTSKEQIELYTKKITNDTALKCLAGIACAIYNQCVLGKWDEKQKEVK